MIGRKSASTLARCVRCAGFSYRGGRNVREGPPFTSGFFRIQPALSADDSADKSVVSKLRQEDPDSDFAIATWNNRARMNVSQVEETLLNAGPAMFRARHIPGTLLLALAACLVTVPSATAASACSKNRARPAAPTSCAMKPSSHCCCCGPARSSPGLATAPQSDERVGPRLILPPPEVPDCECRAAQPTAASSRPQSRPTEERPTGAFHDATLSETTRPTITPVRASLTTGSLPELALYLRTARLLI